MRDKGLDIVRISRDKGVFLELDNGTLSLKSEKGEIDPVLLETIKENKQDIIKSLEKLKINTPTTEVKNLVNLQPGGAKDPVFILPGTFGFSDGYVELAKAFPTDQPIFGINMYGYYDEEDPIKTIEQIAELNIKWIKTIRRKTATYTFIGHSFGGLVAYEMMRQLQRTENVSDSCLILLDTPAVLKPLDTDEIDNSIDAILIFLKNELLNLGFDAEKINRLRNKFRDEIGEEQTAIDFEDIKKFINILGINFDLLEGENAKNIFNLIRTNVKIPYEIGEDLRCKKILFVAEEKQVSESQLPSCNTAEWEKKLSKLKIIQSPGNHESMVKGMNAVELTKKLKSVM